MNFGQRRGLELVKLRPRPEGPKGFFAIGVGEGRVEGKMGLCARAQWFEQHERTKRSARALPARPCGARAQARIGPSRFDVLTIGTELAAQSRVAR